MYLLGIDIGTSSTKSAIFDYKGNLISLSARSYTFDVDKPGYAEQDPEVWWQATAESIAEAIQRPGIDKSQIIAVGLSGQMHGLVGLDAENNVVRKAILHCDVRAKDEVDDISLNFGKEYSDIVYNPIFPGFQAVSLYWLRKNEPASFAKIKKIICPKDYIRYKMTGIIGTEHTDASGTLFYDNRNCGWSPEVFKRLSFPIDIVPEEVHNSCDIAGRVTKEAALTTGLAEGTPVAYGGADQAMHSLGNGVYQDNIMMATIGSSGQVLVVTSKPVKNAQLNTHTFRHVKDGYWYELGAVLSAGSALDWFRRSFCEFLSFDDLSALAGTIPSCSNGLVFLPCLAGERTPYLDPEARGLFTGVSMMHTRAHFARAIMEGVTFAMKSSLNVMNELYGQKKQLICAGGGVKDLIWAQIQADIYGRDIQVSKIREQACLGAAIVAGVGTGLFKDIGEACTEMCDLDMRTIHPDVENKKLYQDMYDMVYSKIYTQNADLFHYLVKF